MLTLGFLLLFLFLLFSGASGSGSPLLAVSRPGPIYKGNRRRYETKRNTEIARKRDIAIASNREREKSESKVIYAFYGLVTGHQNP